MSLITLPALIDPHVHLRDPGETQKEDFLTGTSAALAGGFTTVFDMPNNKIPITKLERLEEKIKIAQEKIVCDIGFYFGSLGDNLDEFPKIRDKVFALKLYLNETTGNFLIDKNKLESIFTTWPKTKPIFLHAEYDAIPTVIELVKKFGNQIHICHISNKTDLEQVIQAKENNLPVTCGVTPHHLFLTEHDLPKLGSLGKVKPPLGSKTDQEFLWKNLKNIDCVESDHAPHTLEEKNAEHLYGIPGLETTLPLLLNAVNENRLTIDDIIRLCHTGPQEILHLNTATSRIDVSIHRYTKTEVDIDEEWTIHGEDLKTKGKWTPFEGMKVKGKVKRVFLRGEKVFENGEILAKPGSGKILS